MATSFLVNGGKLKLDAAASGESVHSPDYMIESAKCFLCDHTFVEGDQPFLIFEKRLRDEGQLECALSVVLSSALGRDVDETEAHSTLLCETCNATVSDFESLEQRFCEIRYRILSVYNRTAQRNALEPIVFEINGVLQDAISTATDNDEVQLQEIIVPELLLRHKSKADIAVDQAGSLHNDKSVDEDCDTLVDEMGDDMSAVVEDSTNAYGFMEADVEEQSEVGYLSTGHDNLDEQDAIIYDDIIEQTSNMDASDEEDKSVSPHILEAGYSSISQSNSDLFVAAPLFKLEGNRYCCLLCKSAPPHLDGKSFAEHMRSAHRTPFYACDLCSSAFEQRQDLDVHINAQHCVVSKYECETCQRVFSNYRLFRLHKRSHYAGGKQFECNICQRKYTSKNLLAEHMNMHTGERPYKCSQCPKDFASKYTLTAHVKIHTERKRPFKCDECNKAFLNQQNLLNHKKLHVDVKTFICEVCSKAFSTQHNLDVHKIVHSGQRPFLCRTCGKSFARRADVKDHERIHTGERPFKCDLCHMAFTQRSNLTSHKKHTHFNEKLHKCDECDRTFKRRRLLDYHIQAAHTGERPYKCEVCDAAFVYPEHYKKHIIIHTGQKPYACEICGKQFNSSDNRKAHRFVHSDKKPYECLDCGAGFMRKPLLLAHMRQMQHTNDTIIVNQPQISEDLTIALASDEIDLTDESVGDTEEAVAVDVSLEDMMIQRASNILALVEDGEEDNDAITTVSGQLIKDELGAVKYLEFADLDGDGQEFTWVDIGGEQVDKD